MAWNLQRLNTRNINPVFMPIPEVSTAVRSDTLVGGLGGRQGRFVCYSRGIRSLRHLTRFLNAECVLSPFQARDAQQALDAVLVWGRKENTQRALAFAHRHELPVWYLEDGWIRSCASGGHGRSTYSLIIDSVGVYYDPRTPSLLENCLNLPDNPVRDKHSAGDLELARENRRRIVEHEITKYNYCLKPVDSQPRDMRPLVLVIDQTRDDASVRYGGMEEADFVSMLDAAIAENPGARVVLRTHPDVVTGRRSGYLETAARRRNIEVHARADNPVYWLKRAHRVYTGTSQMGYEALLCDRPVTVFGMPFYAGWGLTDDRRKIERRSRSRSIDELFLFTHMHYVRYCHPATGERWSLSECIDHVVLQQRRFRENARRFHCVGITPWKRSFIRQYLRSPDGSVTFGSLAATSVNASNGAATTDGAKTSASVKTGTRAVTTVRSGPEASISSIETVKPTLVTWSFRALDTLRATTDQPLIRMEDGFIRSRGLGSDYVPPGSLVVDESGLYFDPSIPSDLENLINGHDCTAVEVERARRLRAAILERRVSKYNISIPGHGFAVPADKLCVLVVGQVEGDQSIQRGSERFRTNRELLLEVRRRRPASWIVYKPHPDVVSGNRSGVVGEVVQEGLADAVDTQTAIFDCIDRCDELHTMTSLAGFEALMQERHVVTYGAPFYAGWGLSEDQQPTPRRQRRRTLDELVFLVLIAYPRYLDTNTGEFITAEDMLDLIHRAPASSLSLASQRWLRPWSKICNITRALRHAA